MQAQSTLSWLAYEDFLGEGTYLQGLHICCNHHCCSWRFCKHQTLSLSRSITKFLVTSSSSLSTPIFLFLAFNRQFRHSDFSSLKSTFGILFIVILFPVLTNNFLSLSPSRQCSWKNTEVIMSRAHLYLGPVCSLEKMVEKLSSFFDKSVHTEHGHIIIVCFSDSAIAFYFILEYL